MTFLFSFVENVRKNLLFLFSLENLQRLIFLLWKICDGLFLFVGKCQTVAKSPIFLLENVRRSQKVQSVCWKMLDGRKKSNLSVGKCQTVAKYPLCPLENIRRSQKNPIFLLENIRQSQKNPIFLLENVRQSQKIQSFCWKMSDGHKKSNLSVGKCQTVAKVHWPVSVY